MRGRNSLGLQHVLDRLEITDVIFRYGQAVDDRDLEGVVSCFSTDIRACYNSGAFVMEGIETVRRFFAQQFTEAGIGQNNPTTHAMTNVIVQVAGERAHVETTALITLTKPEGIIVTRGVHYSDDCVKIQGRWVIQRRVHRPDWQMETPGKGFPRPMGATKP
jgi:ketosteroid isomerase-like protein